jgi:hypothetical protein
MVGKNWRPYKLFHLVMVLDIVYSKLLLWCAIVFQLLLHHVPMLKPLGELLGFERNKMGEQKLEFL